MYHSKKIGVFISHIFGYYQHHVCQGVIDKALEYGYSAEIFTTLDGENLGTYAIGEKSILRIPNFDSFDGIVFASGTYISQDLRQKILNRLQSLSCPVVEITETDNYFPTVSLDNNSTAGELAEHLLTVHCASRVCYLGCKDEDFFSDKRKNAYIEALNKHQKEPGPHDIYCGQYTADSVRKALTFFCKDGTPDAVICYNDRLALLFMDAVLTAGYRIPEDMAITGCDDTPEGHNISPMLTTVSFPVYQLGTTAVENLLAKIHGNELPPVTHLNAEPIYHSSCGCQSHKVPVSFFFTQELTSRIDGLKDSIIGSMNMSSSLQHVTDIDEGMDLLEKYICEVEHCKNFYLCLYPDWDSVSSHILELTETREELSDNDSIQLKLALKNGKRLPECSYHKKYLLPEYLYGASNCSYLCIPLFFEAKEFGYIVLSYENRQIDYYFRLAQWQINISQMLQRLCDAKRTGLLVTHLENIYMKDALTGLYNKHGYSHYEELLLNKAIEENLSLTAFMIDMDGLKSINDTYGHNEGDFAIQVLGHAIESVAGEDDLCARFSGDEFYLLSVGKDQSEAEVMVDNIKAYLENYNKLSTKAYQIFCSCGFACTHPDSDFTKERISELFSEADRMMYIEKAAHHAQLR